MLLENALVFAFEVLLEDHVANLRALFAETLLRPEEAPSRAASCVNSRCRLTPEWNAWRGEGYIVKLIFARFCDQRRRVGRNRRV